MPPVDNSAPPSTRTEELSSFLFFTVVMAPVLARIIEQGKKERVFKVGDPLAAAEIILQITSINSSAMDALTRASGKAAVRTARAALEERLRFQGVAVDRILGLRDGSVELYDARAVKRARA